MSASKSNYPEKPLGGRRPAKPGEQRQPHDRQVF